MYSIFTYWLSIYFYVNFMLCLYVYANEPIAVTKYGNVSGISVELEDGTIIDSYLGIPYAKPPLGDLRFTIPEEPDSWDGTFPATDLGNACMQDVVSSIQFFHPGWSRFSEDCLHLNIYSPQRQSDAKLAVMVWLHGGGYQGGANFVYPGYFIAQRDVVVVTVNYRLGIMGFAYTEDGSLPGNMGLLDQIQALQFIQDNIAGFGGDPDRVTVFGESAGAGSAGLLMMTPQAQGLFHGVILQSGCELSGFAINRPHMHNEDCLSEIALQFDCPVDDTTDMVTCLREVNDRRLSNARCNCSKVYGECGFKPVVDGTIIPDYPIHLRESGEYIHVPEMIGINEDDSYMFVATYYPELIAEGLNRSRYDEIMWDSIYESSLSWPDPSRAMDVFEAVQFFYTDWPYYDDPERNRDMFGKLHTDRGFGYTSDLQAKLHSAAGSQVYYYIYDYVPENYFFPEWIGTFHGTEIMIEFGWPYMYLDGNEMALNHSQHIVTSDYEFTENDMEYSEFMIALWTNFAKYGNPTPEAVDGPNGTAITWSSFSEEDHLSYLNMKPMPEVYVDYRQQEYAFWREYLKYLIFGETFIENNLYMCF